MIGPEPVIVIAGSQRAWASELLRFLSDFGGARLKGTVLTAREALEPGYEVLIIDDITSYLSPGWWSGSGAAARRWSASTTPIPVSVVGNV